MNRFTGFTPSKKLWLAYGDNLSRNARQFQNLPGALFHLGGDSSQRY
jgi:hypothetical protein